MILPKTYEDKIIEYSKSLKLDALPLLSWDVHMYNFEQLAKYRNDLNFINSFTKNVKTEVNVFEEFSKNNAVIVLTDLNLKIEFASHNISKMSGYNPSEVIGKTPKIFQGPKTDKKISGKIREKINKGEKFDFTLVNYKKDNTTYDCHIKGYPIFNKKDEITNFIAIEQVA